MKDEDKKRLDCLSEDNIDDAINAAIEKYFSIGLIVDALFWSKVIAIYRDQLKKEKRKSGRMLRPK